MNVIYFLIPVSLIFLLIAIYGLRFAISSNQYEDMDGAANRIILDDREAVREAAKQRLESQSATDQNPPRES